MGSFHKFDVAICGTLNMPGGEVLDPPRRRGLLMRAVLIDVRSRF
eukprot:CAMPEP_0183301200 /NCGR_PEP_ID=MMETSP0160_2-20130417/7385_1 /TAXON_ID=2839 ORGANISM="Odontella Sinensis, Strain Grunow 1884" /NCGR_SAMPLE_ID=MMETSP0160_2 /ASSEMBLY_ACC=CAM_ASM_000250 /LENGTH=44 /DNA_ID= /DNA_START= /DNA_END= /DNA_ORIENTATION=